MAPRCSSLLSLLLSVAACGGPNTDAEPESRAAPEPAKNQEANEATPPPSENDAPKAAAPAGPHEKATVPTKRKAPTKEEIAKTVEGAKTFQAKLDAGRKAVKTGAYDEAFVAFSAARALRPHDPRVLGESGFASYKAGKLTQARRWTLEAIERTYEPKRLGALHYNMGLIAEAEGDKWTAAQHYRRSLAFRENATVQERLAGLGEFVPPKGPDTLDAYCKQLATEAGCDEHADLIDDPELEYWCGCSVEEHLKSTTPDASITEAAILLVGQEEAGTNIETESLLAVKTRSGGWRTAHREINSWMREFCDSDTDVGQVTSIEFKDVGPGPGDELLAGYEHLLVDLPGLDIDEETDQIDTTRVGRILCSAVGNGKPDDDGHRTQDHPRQGQGPDTRGQGGQDTRRELARPGR
jgi:Flp pilus assembly protein TadD